MDDFCKVFEPFLEQQLVSAGKRHRRRRCGISLSEMMTLVVLFHQIKYRHFKYFYEIHVKKSLSNEFPNMPSYQRCIQLMPRCLVALTAFFNTVKGRCTGISIVDATSIKVCHNKRIYRHRVFKGSADRGKTSMGWFFGFKLHAVINHQGELCALKLTSGNIDDRVPVPALCQDIFGKLLADKGYISKKLSESLKNKGITFLTKRRKNMKAIPQDPFDTLLLDRRSLVETVFDELKNGSQIEHTRHRSPVHFMVNLMAGIVAYCLKPIKPTLNIFTSAPVPY
jgi:transposase